MNDLEVQLNFVKEKLEEFENLNLDLRKEKYENVVESEYCINEFKREIDEKQVCVELIIKINIEICDEVELLKEENKNDVLRIEKLKSDF